MGRAPSTHLLGPRNQNQIPVAAMDSSTQVATKSVLLSRLPHASLPPDQIEQLSGNLLAGLLEAGQMIG